MSRIESRRPPSPAQSPSRPAGRPGGRSTRAPGGDGGRSETDESLTVADLVEHYQRLLLVVTAARAATTTRSADLGGRAVRALATATEIIAGLAVERWPIVRDGLAAGASVAEVGAALGGLEPDEIAAGLRSWADRQYRAGMLSDAEYTGVVALVAAA